MADEGLGPRAASGREAITLAVAHGDATRAPFFAQMGPEEALMTAVRVVFPVQSPSAGTHIDHQPSFDDKRHGTTTPATVGIPSTSGASGTASAAALRFFDELNGLIKEKDALMVSTVKRGRVGVDEGIDALITVREKLEPMVDACNQVGAQADGLHERIALAERQVRDTARVRQNIDTTLELVGQARRLMMMYGRIEKLVAAERLHPAAKLIGRFEEERRKIGSMNLAVARGTANGQEEVSEKGESQKFFGRVIPDAGEITAIIKAKVKLTFRGWMVSLVTAAEDIGRWAIDHLETEGGWVPEVVDHSDQTDMFSLDETRHDEDGRPLIVIRPLLTCLLVERDFGRLSEFRSEYLRSRSGQLSAFTRLEPHADQFEIEECLSSLAGFFITERALSRHAAVGLTTEKELADIWETSQHALRDMLLMLERPRTVPMVRAQVQAYVGRFAQCMRQQGHLPVAIDQWAVAGFALPPPPSAADGAITAGEIMSGSGPMGNV